MKQRLLSIAITILCAVTTAWAWDTLHATSVAQGERSSGFVSSGGVLTGGGGLAKVTTNSPGLLAGSGTSSNPLTATITTTGILSGTGSAGSALTATEVGDISSVVAGTGLSGGATSGAATLNVNLTTTTCAAGQAETATAANGTATCSVFVNAAGTGLALTGSSLATNLTGGACTNSQAVTNISAAGATTCSNLSQWDYGGTHLENTEEFMANHIANTQSIGWWGNSISNSGVVQNGSAGEGTRPGILEMSTGGSSATGRAALAMTPTSVDFGAGNWSIEGTLGFPTLSVTAQQYAFIFGFGDTEGGTGQTDGCYFEYDHGNVATSGPNSGNADKWECWCASNAVRTTYLMDGTTVSDESFTTVNAPVAALTLPNTNIQTLKVVMTGSTRAEFYVNGVKSCDINTHVPSGSSRLTGALMMLLKSNGTTASTANVDRTKIAVDLTSARSP